MRSFAIALALLLCSRAVATAKQLTVSAAHYPDPELLRSIEDPIAEKIIDIRKKAGLQKLTRVYRTEARQFACTAAVEGGKVAKGGVMGAAGFNLEFAVYLTDNTSEAKFGLDHIALFSDVYARRRGFNKFSVAAWPVSDPRHPAGTYGIAIMLFPRWGSNLFEKYLTDGFNFRNEWKEEVAPECRDVK